jgi:signal transduction histidine kinase
MSVATLSRVAGPGRRFAAGRAMAGLTLRGLALVALVCLVNALRRRSMYRPGIDEPIATWLASLVAMFGLSLVVALPVVVAVVATCNLVPVRSAWRYPALAASIVASSLAGTALMVAIEHAFVAPVGLVEAGALDPARSAVEFLKGYWLRYVLLAAFGAAIYLYARAADATGAQARDAELDRERLGQQLQEARLQLLQAQIEPHFLFNTLAMLRRLYQTSPEVAQAMLESLMRYLGAALEHLRAGTTNLADELSLVEAYLAIHRRRMGDRLGFAIDVPDALRAAPLPPLMLLTLVENSVRHGLAPLPEGGFIGVSAAANGDTLRVQVADTGRGFVAPSGTGTGLANIRARLAALYGPSARLEIRANQPRGVVATLVLPLAKVAP